MAFEGLTAKLNAAFKKLRGKGRLSESKYAFLKLYDSTNSFLYNETEFSVPDFLIRI